MSQAQSKLIANLLVVIGVGLCATFGAQLTPKTLHAVTIEQIKTKKLSNATLKVEIEAPFERVKTWWSLSALPFSGGLLLILFGSGWARRLQHAELNGDIEATHADSSANLNSKESLQLMMQTLQELKTLLAENDPGKLEAVKQKIERLQVDTIDPFVESREQFKMKLGINLFVDVFGHFSQGERRINRAWAACVDQHFIEAKNSIDIALKSVDSALSLLSET